MDREDEGGNEGRLAGWCLAGAGVADLGWVGAAASGFLSGRGCCCYCSLPVYALVSGNPTILPTRFIWVGYMESHKKGYSQLGISDPCLQCKTHLF